MTLKLRVNILYVCTVQYLHKKRHTPDRVDLIPLLLYNSIDGEVYYWRLDSHRKNLLVKVKIKPIFRRNQQPEIPRAPHHYYLVVGGHILSRVGRG